MKYLITFLVAVLMFSLYSNYQQKAELESSKLMFEAFAKQAKPSGAIVERYIAKDSTKHAIYTTVYANTPEQKQIASMGYIDTLAKALSISVKQIAELQRLKATVQDKVKLIPDSTQQNYTFNGKYLNAKVSTADTSLEYTYNVQLINTRYYRGNWLTGRRWYNDIAIADPNATINRMDGFTIPPEKQKRVGFGLQVGYRYDFALGRLSPYVGAGVSYNLINF